MWATPKAPAARSMNSNRTAAIEAARTGRQGRIADHLIWPEPVQVNEQDAVGISQIEPPGRPAAQDVELMAQCDVLGLEPEPGLE